MNKIVIYTFCMLGIAAPLAYPRDLTDIISPSARTIFYSGQVTSIADGDTITVDIPGWPEPVNPMEIRIWGIDTPESLEQFAKCPGEVSRGLTAKEFVKARIKVGDQVKLEWMGKATGKKKREKFGRLLARVITAKGENIGAELLKNKLAVPYYGQTKSTWCDIINGK